MYLFWMGKKAMFSSVMFVDPHEIKFGKKKSKNKFQSTVRKHIKNTCRNICTSVCKINPGWKGLVSVDSVVA